MAENDYSQIAMILAIIAAVSFIGGAVMLFLMWGTLSSMAGAYGAYYGAPAFDPTMIILIPAIMSIVAGVMCLIGGMMIKNPAKRQMGSILTLVFAIVGIFGGGGFLLTGTILGIVAGILGLVSKA
jgi:D-alanyl-lipoteichoic acid acyltransferase DltB (MBOAT superfamily)